jgi:hypothetical protein
MASSSSDSSNLSIESRASREMSPEFDPKAAYEACAPLHWDAKEWDFWVWSEDHESLTDGEDLQFLLDKELEDEDGDDDVSWEGYDSSSEEEDGDESTEEDPMIGSFLRVGSSDEDDDEDDGGDPDDGVNGNDGFASDDGTGDNGSVGGRLVDDGDVGVVPQSSAASSQAPTGGRLVSMYQADRLALRAIDSSSIMTSFMNKISLLISCLSKSWFTRSRWQCIGSFPNSVDPSLNRYLNQFHLLLELKTFWEQIQLSPLNSSSAPEPPP